MSLRDEISYKQRRQRFHKALAGIGLENDDVDKLIGRVKTEGLEELMLASYSLMTHIRKYLDTIGAGSEHGFKIPDLMVAIHLAILLYDKVDRHVNGGPYVMLTEEAAKLEHISRAAYCWLKASRMLKPKTKSIIVQPFQPFMGID